jgi:hypothetical protein
VNLALQDQNHPIGRSTLFKKNLAGLSDNFFSMARQPQPVFQR